jgi:hypothetical protein
LQRNEGKSKRVISLVVVALVCLWWSLISLRACECECGTSSDL